MANIWASIRDIAAANSPFVWLAWATVMAIGIGLVVLFRTRWQGTGAIAKCIAFSLYAHLVLALMAYSTRMLFGPISGDDLAVISVKIWNDDELDALLRKQQADEADTEVQDQTVPLEIPESPATIENTNPEEPAPADTVEPQPEQPPVVEETVTPEPPRIEPQETAVVEPKPLLPNVPEDVAPLEPENTIAEAAVADPPVQDNEPTVTPEQLTTVGAPPEQETTTRPFEDIEVGGAGGSRTIVSVPVILRPQPTNRPDRTIVRVLPVTRPVRTGAARLTRYGHRSPAQKRQALLNVLGRDDALVSVDQALRWLQKNQEPDGSWSAQRHGGGRETNTLGHNRHGAGMNAQTAMTGLAVLAFVGAGYDHREGPYHETIATALDYLILEQRSNGDLSGDASLFAAMYCHGMASLALAESLAYTGDDRLRTPVKRAVQFTVRSQDPNTGSWRYAPGDGQGDMSQFGWQVMLLTTAELSGIEIPEVTRFRMQRFVERMSAGQAGGLARYQRGHRPSRTMTAESLVCRQFLRIDLTTAAEQEAFDYLRQQRAGQGRLDLYYCYYASLALVQYQSPQWQKWVSEMETVLRQQQRTSSSLAGSWDPDTKWGGYGGRVYSTALATLCLEVFYRYADADTAPNASQVPQWTRQDGRWSPIRR